MEQKVRLSLWLSKHKFELFLSLTQAAIILVLGLCSEYEFLGNTIEESNSHTGEQLFTLEYSLFEHISIMIFIGFGFLMVFLKSHSLSSVGFNYLAAVVVIELYIVFFGLWTGIVENKWHSIKITIELMVNAEFCAAAVLISFGGVLGKVSPLQLVVMAMVESFFYSMNERIVLAKLDLVDMGGSITIHIFGAYFGLMVTWIVSPEYTKDHPENAANYHSSILSFIGTIFLWILWPSFNGVLATGHGRHRMVIGTIFSLCGSCIATFIFTRALNGGKLNVEDILNATLSGGVVVGASAFLMKDPYIPVLAGSLTGIVSTWGFERLSPYLQRRFKLYDTCGIHNLHGMPGILGGFVSMFVIALTDNIDEFIYHEPIVQVGYQFASMCVTLSIAIVSGISVGYLLKTGCLEPPKELFTDKEFWDGELDQSVGSRLKTQPEI